MTEEAIRSYECRIIFSCDMFSEGAGNKLGSSAKEASTWAFFFFVAGAGCYLFSGFVCLVFWFLRAGGVLMQCLTM